MVHNKSGQLVPFDFKSILEHIPSLRQLQLNLTVIAFNHPIDSSNITPDDWVQIGDVIYQNYEQYNGFVILHGTDTMAFTASALSFMFRGLDKPIILTGAQLPISSPRSDARENLITALEIASTNDQHHVNEVCIYFNYTLLRGNRSKKVESLFFDAFESDNYPKLAESGIVINYNQAVLLPAPDEPIRYFNKFDTNVVLLKLYPGIREEVVKNILQAPGVKGAVMETYGAGNAPTAGWFEQCLGDAIKNNLVIMNVSQCTGGRVWQGRYETSSHLNALGVLSGADITAEAAITKMMMILAEEQNVEEIRKRLTTPIGGEMEPG